MEQGLLRFITAGSVDDGKSTLIGRLLYDSKTIFEDQLESIEEASTQRGTDAPHRCANAWTRSRFAIGMMPGTMGTPIPLA